MAQIAENPFDQIERESLPSFRPEPWYNQDGDSIHYNWEPEEFYADRIDDKLTVYRSIETNAIIGCQIKGISALTKQLGEFGLHLHEDGIPLATFIVYSHIIASAAVAEGAEGKRRETYLYLLEKAGRNRVELGTL